MISFISLTIVFMYMNVSPVMYGIFSFTVLFHEVPVRTFKGLNQELNNQLRFLVYSSILILHTIWRVIMKHSDSCDLQAYVNKYHDWLALFLFCPSQILLPIYFHDSSSLFLCWPAIADILDGIHMTESQLDPAKNLVWVQASICLAVFMCYVPSLYEIYHLIFPEPTIRSINLSKRRVNLIQLASSVVFLVLRFVLWARDAGKEDPTEVIKSIFRFYGHFKMWLILRRRRRIISVEAREISADKASYFDKEKKAFLALRDAIILLMQTFKRNEPEMRISVY